MKRAALVILGAYVCVLGSFVHRNVTIAGGVDWPWGLVVVVAVTYLVTVAADLVTRVGGAWFGLGWAIGLMVQQISPGGSYLVASDWLGWSFTAASLGAIVVAVVRPPRVGE
ncbi:MAG: hypothetical protein JWP31_1481 [Aeromicrobium sp.]|nr:hypothetical protein [Aeromicrobium sp.]